MKRFIYFLVALSFLSCESNKKETVTSNSKNIIKIGSILPLSGPAAAYGEYVKSGQEKAINEVNSKFLIDTNDSLVVMFEDGKGLPKESIISYNKLRGEGVNIFNTTISNICLPIIELAKNDEVLVFADAAHPSITNPIKPFVFRHSNTSTQEVNLILEHVSKNNIKNVAIIAVNDDYGVSFKNDFDSLVTKYSDIKLSFFESYGKQDLDFKILVEKLKPVQNDIIILVGYGQSLGLLLKEIRDKNIETPLLASIGYIITESYKFTNNQDKGIEFVNFDFKDSNHTGIDNFEILGYGTTILIGEAIKNGHKSPLEIKNYLESINKYETSNELMIINNHDITPNLKIEKK
jgi:branched-chain amino acid transport system substrate-binding protein